MKRLFYTATRLLVVALLALTTISCKEDYTLPSTQTACQSAPPVYPNHPKAVLYQQVLNKYIAQGLPGVAMLVRSPENGYWLGAAGKADIASKTTMEGCHLQYIQSISKMYVATAVLLLAEQNVVALDNSINHYLPATITAKITQSHQITVRQLLNHSSGIPDYASDATYITDFLNNPLYPFTSDKYLGYVAGKRLKFAPGTDYSYSNTNYLLLTILIDQVTGASHAKYITDHIFKPLNLHDTYYLNEPAYPQPTGLVSSYYDRRGNGYLEDISKIQNQQVASMHGDDGIIASPYDVVSFTDAILKGNLLTVASKQQMRQFIATQKEPEKLQYGLGLHYFETDYGNAYGHGGSGLGSSCFVAYFPDEDITIFVAVNMGVIMGGPLAKAAEQLQNEVIETVLK
ncbi:D-alanyl-D-alanine carboxypeptidase [Adhaeribacter arboris]|uniref:D-alanyl-D-alanine carboxypeptidase n=1 Tax=Adhaeribacter arboris TaxID=2072846 RepID=A0A2T2Y8P2_9BACT|nr:serine hydrolase domain-containing protein [Adhaeribacter arboris]PSR51889.1 D-alanyl-D-alanine carboxypeptidase [Adhaeribacter arboris]